MKLSSFSRHLMTGAAVAGLALGSSVALAGHIQGISFTAEPFTVNPGAVGETNASFSARYIDFSYRAEVDQTGFAFEETGGGFFGTFRMALGGSPIANTGLGTDYQMYALYSGDGTSTANAIGGVDGVFNTFNVTFFVDPSMNTTLDLVGGSIATTGGAGDDIAVLSGVLGAQEGGFHVFSGLAAGDFHVQFDATALGGFFGGAAFAGGTTTGDINGVNTQVTGVTLPPSDFTDAIIIGSGNTSFSAVPEPGMLFLLGIGMAGMGFVSSQAKKKRTVV
jgi:hypothetical protein